MKEPDETIDKNRLVNLSPKTKLRVLQRKIEAKKMEEAEFSQEGLETRS
jgi:hypothetical protein